MEVAKGNVNNPFCPIPPIDEKIKRSVNEKQQRRNERNMKDASDPAGRHLVSVRIAHIAKKGGYGLDLMEVDGQREYSKLYTAR